MQPTLLLLTAIERVAPPAPWLLLVFVAVSVALTWILTLCLSVGGSPMLLGAVLSTFRILGFCLSTLFLHCFLGNFQLYHLLVRYDDVCSRAPGVPVLGTAPEGKSGLAIFGWDEAVGAALPAKLLSDLLLLQVLQTNLLLSHPPHPTPLEGRVIAHELGHSLFLVTLLIFIQILSVGSSLRIVFANILMIISSRRFLLVILGANQRQHLFHFDHFVP